MADRSGDTTGARRGRGPRALAAMVPRVAGTALRRRGFAETRVVTDWADIIGPELARQTMPERLTFPRGSEGGGTLRIRAAGPLALELQHLEPLVIERINRYFGFAAVARLAFVQAPVAAAPRRARAAPAALSPEAARRLDAAVENIESESLRAALTRLGRAVIGGQRS
jgi:hypothetical protein